MMNDHGKSDNFVVPAKPPNNGTQKVPAEGVEERRLAKGNQREQNMRRAQDRARVQSALTRIREAAQRDKEKQFTTLLHHVYSESTLREAYLGLTRRASPGVDGITWQEYGKDLEDRIQDLSKRLKRGGYRARPVRRTYIPKADGGQRPLGITALEDKIVQAAVTMVLSAIYEVDFLGFSYGFRPGRNQHNALDAIAVGIQQRKVSWVLDADIKGFFDNISHEQLVELIKLRILDKRIIRLIQKWLKAGVLEQGIRTQEEKGTPQGGSVSPLLANIYLHYVFDQWAHSWRRGRGKGDVIIVRYADDIVMGFQHRRDAECFLEEMRERLEQFELELHPVKTRLIEFGRFAAETRRRRGLGKPETFNFLGFTHYCGKTKKGTFFGSLFDDPEKYCCTLARSRKAIVH